MENKKPNILLITTDQQRYDTIHAAGYPHMITPNLDRLCDEGCRFTRAYSPNPVCLPARHNLITGLSAKHHTFDDNYFDDSHQIPQQLPTFAQKLSDAGYDAIAVGKMHFQPYRRHNGFTRLYLMDEIPRYREDDDYAVYLKNNGYDWLQSLHGVRHILYMQPQQSLVDIEHHGSSWVADKVIDYLKTKSKDKPFLIWAGFIAPHPPFDVPREYAHLYDNKELPLPTKSKTSLCTTALDNQDIADYPDEKVLMRARQLYCSSITFVDHQIGRMLKQLENMGELDNTFILFTSDHGEMLGDLGTYQKFLPYDASARIPMIVRYPQLVKAGSVNNAFVDLNDIFPTFMDVCGLQMPKNYDYPGDSLFGNNKDRSVQYIEHQHDSRRWVSLVSERYKYNYFYGGAREELFDLLVDPEETDNLMESIPESVKGVRDQLKVKLVELEARYGLPRMVKNGDFRKLPPFNPRFDREKNLPFFPKHLNNQAEIDALMSLEQEAALAIKDEPLVQLERMDLSAYEGLIDLEKVKDLVKKIR